jgi:hypothetical protein
MVTKVTTTIIIQRIRLLLNYMNFLKKNFCNLCLSFTGIINDYPCSQTYSTNGYVGIFSDIALRGKSRVHLRENAGVLLRKKSEKRGTQSSSSLSLVWKKSVWVLKNP